MFFVLLHSYFAIFPAFPSIKRKALWPTSLPKKRAATFGFMLPLRQNRRPDWSNMVGCQTICQFLTPSTSLIPAFYDVKSGGQCAPNSYGLPINPPDFPNRSAKDTRSLLSKNLSVWGKRKEEYPRVLLDRSNAPLLRNRNCVARKNFSNSTRKIPSFDASS